MADMINRWKTGLERTRKAAFGRILTLVGSTDINKDTWEQLESLLLQSDLGVPTTESILTDLRTIVVQEGVTRIQDLRNILQEELVKHLLIPEKMPLEQHHPAVVLLVGVNGSGKTTTAAKLGYLFQTSGKKVLLAAADTYRAAAIDQLQAWADQLKIPVIAGQPDSDPGAVAFDAIQSAIARNYDLVIIDTAGRLHTRYNLMEELKKVHRVVEKALPGAPHAVLLVLDATTGQNALYQAKAFVSAVNVNGVILTKLDTSARGGMAFAIQKELGLPIYYAGLGEQPEDLKPFDRVQFVENILN